MLTKISPRLGRFNIVSNSFAGCVANAPKEFSRTPEVSFLENFPQPRMLMQEFEGTITLEQLQSSANAHCWRHLNKQVDVVNSNVQFINLEPMPVSCLPDKKLAVHSYSIELHGIMGIFTFPDKMKGILSKAMIPGSQIHFFAPQTFIRSKVLTMFVNLVSGAQQSLSHVNNSQELNFTGDRIPPMFENMGILRQM